MGLVKEPDKIDFYVMDKPWTEEERKELSAFIKSRKEQSKKVRNTRTAKKKTIV
jgi:hypothetical protein